MGEERRGGLDDLRAQVCFETVVYTISMKIYNAIMSLPKWVVLIVMMKETPSLCFWGEFITHSRRIMP